MAKHTYHFKHDFNAHNDEKILDLRMELGFEGYGIFWYLIENLASAEGYRLGISYKRLGFSSGANPDVLKKVVEDFNLFTVKDDFFWSESLMSRMQRLDEIKLKRAEIGAKGGKAKAIGKQLVSKGLANSSIGEESKGEESKEKDSKEEESKGNTENDLFEDEEKSQEHLNHETNPKRFPKDLQMVLDYCFIDRKAYSFDAWAFFETFTDNHWCYPAEKPIKDWKGQIRTWISKNYKPISLAHKDLASDYITSIRGVRDPELVSKTRIGLLTAQKKGIR